MMTLLGVFSLRTMTLRLAATAVAVIALTTVALPFLPQSSNPDIRIYSKNLWFNNPQTEAIAADIRKSEVDAVFLQEVSETNISLLDLIEDEFPHQHICQFSRWSGIAIASRQPFIGENQCSDWRAIAAAQISHDGQPLWLVSAHIPWPWPTKTAKYESAGFALLTALEGPMVIVGDFNIFPWAGRMRKTAALTGTKLAGPTQVTLTFRGLPLPIDHALAPGGGHIETRPLLGGDHKGIVADLGLTP